MSSTPSHSEEMSDEIIKKLQSKGVFKGFEGIEGLLNHDGFWEGQMYGARLYYGDGITEYLHRSVLRAAVELLNEPVPQLESEIARLRAENQIMGDTLTDIDQPASLRGYPPGTMARRALLKIKRLRGEEEIPGQEDFLQ